MLIEASFRTPRLSESEEQQLNDSLGGPEEGLDVTHADRCIAQNFTVVAKTVIGSRFTQSSVEEGKERSEAVENLLKVARLLTWPEKYIAKYGKKTYDIVLAEAHWTVYILLGKVEPTVWIVQKA